MTLKRPCIDCGRLIGSGSRCQRCERVHDHARRPGTTDRMGKGWASLSKRVLERDGYRCQLRLPGCRGAATTTDHVVPRSKGGTSEVDNLVAACRHCNSVKGARRRVYAT